MKNLELYKLVREIVLLATDCPVAIRSNPNAQSPNGEYCSISVRQSKRQRGQAIVRRSNVGPVTSPIGDVYNVRHSVAAQVIADVSVNFYRGDAHDYALQLFQANKRPDVSELLFRNNVGWNGANPINNLNALQSESWEDRSQVTIRLMYESIADVETNAIYQTPLEAEDFDTNSVIYDDTIISPNP